MKIRYAPLFIAGAALFLYACTKDTPNYTHINHGRKISYTLDTALMVTPASASIIGKWQLIKERLQVQGAVGGQVADTTYNSSVFDLHNYIQFNIDSTATAQADVTCSVFGVSGITDAAGLPALKTSDYTYHITGASLLLLSKPPVAAIGTTTRTIAKLDTHNLTIRQVLLLNTARSITDSFYTR